MLDLVVSYHFMQFQGRLINQTWKNGKKPSFGPYFGPFGTNLDCQILFVCFFNNLALSVTGYYCHLSSCTISEKTRYLSTYLNCGFRKSYQVTTLTPITASKLVEHLVKIHLMLLKKVHNPINVKFAVFKSDILLCLQFICCAYAATWKVRLWGTLYKEDIKKGV